jgi:hypothetical protein
MIIIRDAPDTDFSGYPVGPINVKIKSRTLDIRCRPDTGYPAGF